MTTTLQDPAALRLVAGRVRAIEKQPYLATALFAIKPIREPRVPTAGVDAQWRMYWNPEFVLTLTVDEVAAVWLHEVGHLLREHRDRFLALGEPQSRHPLWNRAADAAINDDLRAAQVHLPPIKAVFTEHIPGACTGMSAEQMYRLVLDTPEAERVLSNPEPLRLLPAALLTGKTQGQAVIAITRTGFLDASDCTVTLTAAEDPTAAPLRVTGPQVHDARTLGFTIDVDLPAGTYAVTVTSAETTVTALLPVYAPAITLRPDHIPSGWTAPHQVTVVGQFTDFTPQATVAVTNAETAQPVPVSATVHVSKSYLTFSLTEQVPSGLYTVTVTDGSATLSAALPIGLPFMDIVPASLPTGHGTPYPFAAVVDDFTFEASTSIAVSAVTPFGLVPVADALSPLTVKTATSGDFAVLTSLPEGQYAVVATTGTDRAVATLTVSSDPGPGEGSGDGSGDGSEDQSGEGSGDGSGEDQSGEGSGRGSGKGSGDQSGEGEYDDCGSGAAGGQPRPWDRGEDTSDGSVDTGRGNLIREQTARQIQEHAKSRGNVPGGWSRWADTILKPQVDWRRELKSVVRRTCDTVTGARDYTYQRPSRRASVSPYVVLPALRAPRPPQVAVVVDTSGSVSDRMLGQALGDMTALLKQVTSGGGDSLKIIACDAVAAAMKSVRSMSALTSLDGGGGTDMRVGINAAAALTPKADLIVTFTDGETPWPDAPPAANARAKYVAVLLAGDTSTHYAVPEWIHKIVVDESYLRTGSRTDRRSTRR